MPDNDTKPGTTVQGGQAPVQPASTSGQPNGANSGQSAEVKPGVSFDYEKGYKELQPQFTKVTQENASLKKDVELFNALREDERYQKWVKETFQGGASHENPPEDNEEDEYWTPSKNEAKTFFTEVAKSVFSTLLQSDPLRQEYGKEWIENQFTRAEKNGCPKIMQYRTRIEEFARANPSMNLSPEQIYHMLEGEDRAKQEAVDRQKENLSTESPGISPAGTLPDPKNLDSILDHAFAKLHKK